MPKRVESSTQGRPCVLHCPPGVDAAELLACFQATLTPDRVGDHLLLVGKQERKGAEEYLSSAGLSGPTLVVSVENLQAATELLDSHGVAVHVEVGTAGSFNQGTLTFPSSVSVKEQAYRQTFSVEEGVPVNPGTVQHFSGDCHPCTYHVRHRCLKSDKCSFCHHPEHKRQKRKKKKPAEPDGNDSSAQPASTPPELPARQPREEAVLTDDWTPFLESGPSLMGRTPSLTGKTTKRTSPPDTDGSPRESAASSRDRRAYWSAREWAEWDGPTQNYETAVAAAAAAAWERSSARWPEPWTPPTPPGWARDVYPRDVRPRPAWLSGWSAPQRPWESSNLTLPGERLSGNVAAGDESWRRRVEWE